MAGSDSAVSLSNIQKDIVVELESSELGEQLAHQTVRYTSSGRDKYEAESILERWLMALVNMPRQDPDNRDKDILLKRHTGLLPSLCATVSFPSEEAEHAGIATTSSFYQTLRNCTPTRKMANELQEKRIRQADSLQLAWLDCVYRGWKTFGCGTPSLQVEAQFWKQVRMEGTRLVYLDRNTDAEVRVLFRQDVLDRFHRNNAKEMKTVEEGSEVRPVVYLLLLHHLCYYAMRPRGQQYGLSYEHAERLYQKWGVRTIGFASAANFQLAQHDDCRFFSGFPIADAPAGARETFWEADLLDTGSSPGNLFVNPVFLESILEQAATKILAAIGGNRSLCPRIGKESGQGNSDEKKSAVPQSAEWTIHFFGPHWPDAAFFKMLTYSAHLSARLFLAARSFRLYAPDGSCFVSPIPMCYWILSSQPRTGSDRKDLELQLAQSICS